MTADEIRQRVREMLVETIEAKAANHAREEWRTGIPGAILEGRIAVLEEILDWMDGESSP